MLRNGTLRGAPALLDALNVLGVPKSLLSGPSWVESFLWEVLCPVLGEESYGILPMGLQSLHNLPLRTSASDGPRQGVVHLGTSKEGKRPRGLKRDKKGMEGQKDGK